MSLPRTSYSLPNEIFDDLDGLTKADRLDLLEVWSMIVDEADLLDPKADNGKSRVRNAVMEQVVLPESSKLKVVQTQRQPIGRVFDLRFRLVSIAAALVVGISTILGPTSQQFQSPIGSGMPSLVSLSDSSTVSLAPGSRLNVPSNFGTDSRQVILHGQAFFDVAAGALPFEVKTFDARTRVLGTSFSVKAWPGSAEAASEVVVQTGRVSVSTNVSKVLVNPGETTSIDLQAGLPTTPRKANVASNLSWTKGGFYFDQELVVNVIEEVERRFDVEIDAPVSIRLRRFSYATKEVVTASDVMGDLAATIGIRYRATANGFELYLQ